MEQAAPAIPPEEERFTSNVAELSQLVHLLVSKAYNEGFNTVHPDLVAVAGCFLSSLDALSLIQGFIRRGHFHWDKIRLKEQDFFLANAGVMFGELPVSHVDAFKVLFSSTRPDGSSVISPEDVSSLWDFFSSLVRICIKYIHRERHPYSYRTEQGVTHAYKRPFFEEVDIPTQARHWAINLDFPLESRAVQRQLIEL